MMNSLAWIYEKRQRKSFWPCLWLSMLDKWVEINTPYMVMQVLTGSISEHVCWKLWGTVSAYKFSNEVVFASLKTHICTKYSCIIFWLLTIIMNQKVHFLLTTASSNHYVLTIYMTKAPFLESFILIGLLESDSMISDSFQTPPLL